jgi:hypothetical protein
MAGERVIGRRALFFLLTAVVGMLLYYPTPSEFRWVCLVVVGLGLFWAVLQAVEDLTAPTDPRRTRPRARPSTGPGLDLSPPEREANRERSRP